MMRGGARGDPSSHAWEMNTERAERGGAVRTSAEVEWDRRSGLGMGSAVAKTSIDTTVSEPPVPMIAEKMTGTAATLTGTAARSTEPDGRSRPSPKSVYG